jgi:hypothetical protein
MRAEEPQNPEQRFRELAATRKKEQEALSGTLEGGMRNCFSFVQGTFGKSQELVIFLTELRNFEAARRFMETRLRELYESAASLLDLKAEEEELRSRLRG